MVKYTGRQRTRIGTVNTNQGRNMSGTSPNVGTSFRTLTANRSGGNYQTCGPVLYHGNVIKTNTSENSLCLPPAPVGRTLAGGVGVANVPRLSMCSSGSCNFKQKDSNPCVNDLELGKEIWAKNYKKVINLAIRYPSDSTYGTPNNRIYCTGWYIIDENDNLFIITGSHCVLAYNEASPTQVIPNSRYTDKVYVNIFDQKDEVFRIIRGTVVAGDGAGDVAIIQLYNTANNTFFKASDLGITEGFEFGKSRESPPGSKVFVISNPGIADMFSISSGVVRDNVFNNGQSYVLESLLHSAPIDGGSSGAPILDKNGRIIGMHTWAYTQLTNMGGGITQFMLEGIVKKMIVSRNDTPQLTPQPYENDKSFFNLTAYELNSGNIVSYGVPGMGTFVLPGFEAVVNDNKGVYYYVDPSAPREIGPVAENLVVKNEDVVFELTYTPSEQAKAYDPNYVAPNTPVTLTIGAFPKEYPATSTSAPIQVPATSALWWIDNNNVLSVYIKVYDINGTLVERHAAGWDVIDGLKFMPHTIIDTPLENVSNLREDDRIKSKKYN